MNKRKLVIFTCFGILLGFSLYFFYSKQGVSPIGVISDKKQEVQKEAGPTHGSQTISSFTPSYPDSDKRENPTQVELQEQLQNLKKFCEEEYPQYQNSFPTVRELQSALEDKDLRQMWLNIHLKDTNDRVWRVRRFTDDGPNGEVERVILYKEDETGFPKIVESSESQKDKSSSELLQNFLSKGQPIFTDEAYSTLYNKAEYFFELTNGQITRIDISSSDGYINCQVPH